MNVKYLIFGIIAFVIGILFLIWIIKNPLFNKNDDDGSIEGGIRQLGRKNDDIRGYISAIGFIILGIILILNGITGE